MDKKNYKDLLKEFKEVKKQLNEHYFFNEKDMPVGDGEIPYEGEAPDMEEGDSAEEQAMHAQEVVQHEPIIGKIRETAIEGLKKYSDNPTSDIYLFFKKVFLESDKVLTDGGKGK